MLTNHLGSVSNDVVLSPNLVSYSVQHRILHKNADGTTDEGRKKVDVDVVTSAVQPPTEERDRH